MHITPPTAKGCTAYCIHAYDHPYIFSLVLLKRRLTTHSSRTGVQTFNEFLKMGRFMMYTAGG